MPNFFVSYKRVKVAGGIAAAAPAAARRVAPDLKQTRRDPAKGPPDLAARLPRRQGAKTLRAWGVTGVMGDEAVHGMDGLGRAGCHGHGSKCSDVGAIRKRETGVFGRR